MTRPRVSLTRLLAFVASSLAILKFLLSRGRSRRIYAGFTASGPAAVAVYHAVQGWFPSVDGAFTDWYFVPALDTRSMADSRAVETTWYARSKLGYYLFLTLTALVTSLPFLALALTAGRMALAVCGRPRSPLVSSPSPS